MNIEKIHSKVNKNKKHIIHISTIDEDKEKRVLM